MRATTVVEFCWVVVWAVGVRAGMNSRLYPRRKLGKEVHVGRAFFAPDQGGRQPTNLQSGL